MLSQWYISVAPLLKCGTRQVLKCSTFLFFFFFLTFSKLEMSRPLFGGAIVCPIRPSFLDARYLIL